MRGFAPNSVREVAIRIEAGNDVPVYVRRLVAQAGQVDLVRP